MITTDVKGGSRNFEGGGGKGGGGRGACYCNIFGRALDAQEFYIKKTHEI